MKSSAPRVIPYDVAATLRYIRQEIAHRSDITLCPEDARELLEYLTGRRKPDSLQP